MCIFSSILVTVIIYLEGAESHLILTLFESICSTVGVGGVNAAIE